VRKQKQVPTYGHHASVALFSALNAMTGEMVHQTEDFLSFLQFVANHYKDKLIAMVIDNAKIQLIQDFFAKNKRIMSC
jgi:hypothetical protein